MVSALVSRSSGPGGSTPGRGHLLCSGARHFILTVAISTQVYKWVPANLMLGVTLLWTGIPSILLGPVHTNPFSNGNGAGLLRIRLSSTLQHQKRSSKTERFENDTI